MADADLTGAATARPNQSAATPRLDEPVLPAGDGATSPGIRTDIAKVLFKAVDALARVQNGLNAVLATTADNNSEFASTAHWMVSRIDEDFSYVAELIRTAHKASRAHELVIPMINGAENVQAAVDRLKEIAAKIDNLFPADIFGQEEAAVKGAVADATFVLARALHWQSAPAFLAGLKRAGVISEAAA